VARVEEYVAIGAPAERVLGIIGDLDKRQRILPNEWRVLRRLTEKAEGVGASIEMEWRVGPAPTLQVLQILELTGSRQVEGPPPADNYLTTWTVETYGAATWTGVMIDFSYGDVIGEFFVKRRLRKACREMLQRLKEAAEAQPGVETA
jgi:hypothetical protein